MFYSRQERETERENENLKFADGTPGDRWTSSYDLQTHRQKHGHTPHMCSLLTTQTNTHINKQFINILVLDWNGWRFFFFKKTQEKINYQRSKNYSHMSHFGWRGSTSNPRLGRHFLVNTFYKYSRKILRKCYIFYVIY